MRKRDLDREWYSAREDVYGGSSTGSRNSVPLSDFDRAVDALSRAHEAEIDELKTRIVDLREQVQELQETLEAEHRLRVKKEKEADVLASRLRTLSAVARERRESLRRRFVLLPSFLPLHPISCKIHTHPLPATAWT